jgi:hypothetical protein
MVQLDPDTNGVPALEQTLASCAYLTSTLTPFLPIFSEEQIYALAKHFDAVVSVRTFARHISDRSSGCGLVLFDSVESAESTSRVFEWYRNLHPSFCKTFHPIPGTRYISLPSSGTPLSSAPSSLGTDGDSFKSRMDRLKDARSTNLYIECLPLSVDETTMVALVVP